MDKEWLMLHGVQGLAPARGRRRNACTGERWAIFKGSLKTLQMRFQAAFILLARVKSKLPFNQYSAVVGIAPRQSGGLHVASLAVQNVVYVQPE